MTNPITAELRSAKADECCNDILCGEAADHIDAQDAKIKALTEALDDTLAWVDAVPSGTPLPAMPGFDRDALNDVLAAVKEPT